MAKHDAVDAGAGAALTQDAFGTEDALSLEMIPTRFRSTSAAGRAVVPIGSASSTRIEKAMAGQVTQLDKPRRKPDGSIVQRRIAWSATSSAVTISVIERDLTRRDDGKLTPTGQWLLDTRTTHTHLGDKATLRMGAVAFDTQTGTSEPTADFVADTINEIEVAGETVLPYLPIAVRAQLIRAVPEPTIFYGQMLMFPHDGHHEIHLLRLDDTTAVAIYAEAARNARAWSLKQATYTLGHPQVES